MNRRVRRKGRPKLRLQLKSGDRKVLQRIVANSGCTRREALIARSMLLAATGKFTHQEIADEIKNIDSKIEPADILNLHPILRRLQQQRVPAVAAVWRRLTPSTQATILKGTVSNPGQLKTALASEFTTLVQSGAVFDRSHFAFIGGADDLEQEFVRGIPGARLAKFNRKFLNRILDGEIRENASANAVSSQIQIWISRYRHGGLDEVLRNRHARPRGSLGSLELMTWLIKGLKSGKVKIAEDVVPWLRRRHRSCRLELSTADRHLKNWKRLRSLGPANRLKTFLVNNGFIHRLSNERHEIIGSILQNG